MIYTSYFAKLKQIGKLNDSEEGKIYIPISICAKTPNWYTGWQYKKLAPKYNFFMEWKQNHDNDFYIEHFQKEVLDTLDLHQVLKDFVGVLDKDTWLKRDVLTPIWLDTNINFVLLCYEKPSDFCHRHLVADWINKELNGEYVKELEF